MQQQRAGSTSHMQADTAASKVRAVLAQRFLYPQMLLQYRLCAQMSKLECSSCLCAHVSTYCEKHTGMQLLTCTCATLCIHACMHTGLTHCTKQRARELQARRDEDISLHRAYRLASRAVQALELLDILLDVQVKQVICALQ
jgi:hypothetical protein